MDFASRATGRSTLVLETLPDAPHEPDSVADVPLVGFDAFLVDRRVFGWVRLSGDRLTDCLNDHAEVMLINAQVEGLIDGRLEWHERLVLGRGDLLAVRAGGPRGDPARRVHARHHALAVQCGPFLLGGHLHAAAGISALDEIRGRPDLVPLSTAWLEYWHEGRRRHQWVGTILFNRALAEAIEVVSDDDLEFGALSWPIRQTAAREEPDVSGERCGPPRAGPAPR